MPSYSDIGSRRSKDTTILFQKLEETLAALLITKQIVGNCGEILGPTLISWVKVYLLRRHISTEKKSAEKLSQVETESEKPRYDSSFDDYLEMFIQVGLMVHYQEIWTKQTFDRKLAFSYVLQAYLFINIGQ